MSQLTVTSVVLGLEFAILVFLFLYSRRPAQFGQVRLIPYRPLMFLMVLLILATGAHLVSLLTGTQLQPRRPKGM